MFSEFINDSEHCVDHAIDGLVSVHSNLQRFDNVVARLPTSSCLGHRCVALVSGGGSGHEPSHCGLVGVGMLTAAVAGRVFTSPSPEDVRRALLAALHVQFAERDQSDGCKQWIPAESPGILVVVKNYTGDCLSFGLAVENLLAEGWPVELVVVDDDCAPWPDVDSLDVTSIHSGSGDEEKLPSAGNDDSMTEQSSPRECMERFVCGDSVYLQYRKQSRGPARGLAGTVLVHKIAGALAYRGASLTSVAKLARALVSNLSTLNASMCSMTSEATACDGSETFIPKGLHSKHHQSRCVELGLGIHGEAGVRRQMFKNVTRLVQEMLQMIVQKWVELVPEEVPRKSNEQRDTNKDISGAIEPESVCRAGAAGVKFCSNHEEESERESGESFSSSYKKKRFDHDDTDLGSSSLSTFTHTDDSQIPKREHERRKEQFVLLVNNLGGTSCLELQIVVGEAVRQLATHYPAVAVCRVIYGPLLTSLTTHGVSLTLLNLTRSASACDVSVEIILELLHAQTEAPAWPGVFHLTSASAASSTGIKDQLYRCHASVESRHSSDSSKNPSEPITPSLLDQISFEQFRSMYDNNSLESRTASSLACTSGVAARLDSELVRRCLTCACRALISCSRQLNQLDADGDCGTTMARAGQLVLSELASDDVLGSRRGLFLWLAGVWSRVGGTSGAIYTLALTAAARTGDSVSLAGCVHAACRSLHKYTGVQRGDRSVYDALAAIASVFSRDDKLQLFIAAAEAAEAAAIQTAGMRARVGRASYVRGSAVRGLPDPGAHAVGIWMRAMAETAKLYFGTR